MEYDLVHDIQKAYRKIIDCQSSPGTITDLNDEAKKIDLDIGCLKSTIQK